MPDSDSPSFQNKCALITGAARRIGATIAARLHDAGAMVAIHYRGSDQAATDLRDQLNAKRENSAEIFQADLNNDEHLASLVKNVTQWSGQLDVLVNNASSFYPTPMGTVTNDQWDDLIGSNLKAPLFLSQAAMPALVSSRGCIINIVDIHAQRPLRDHAVYGAAKAGLAMLTRSLAKDLAPAIRVNGVAPGAILWPEDEMSQETREKILDAVPLGRQGAPGDIAGAVIYLARDAQYVTGQIIAVDGGRSLGW